MGRRLRTQSWFDLAPGDPGGDSLLRQAIVDYLCLSCSIDCQPEQVLITGNHATPTDLSLRTPAQPGGHMWMEDPRYPFIRPVVEARQLVVGAIPVDDEGVDVGRGLRYHPQARFTLLAPAHQNPLEVALSLPRRRQLLAWATARDTWIIEDNYDSELRYHGRPLPPVKSLDAPQRAVYAGTFSKSMFPALCITWLVVPTSLAVRFHQTAERQPCTVPALWQQTLTDFVQQGYLWRHLKKMHAGYSQRRQWLEPALQAQGFQVMLQQGGTRLVMPVSGNDRLLARQAAEAGLAVQALSDWRLRHTGEGGSLMSSINIRSAVMADAPARRLREVIANDGA